jgi:hypothetical protein
VFSFKNGIFTCSLSFWLPAFLKRLAKDRETWLASGQPIGREKRWFDGILSVAWRIDPPR